MDPWTRYRFFDERSVEQARRVRQLRELEFSLAEIREVIAHPQGGEDLLELLERRRAVVADELSRYDRILRSLDERIQTQREALMTTDPFPIDRDAPRRVERWLARLTDADAAAGTSCSFTVCSAWGAGGGDSLAVVLGRRVGFDVWDRELVGAIARSDELSRAVLDGLSEERRQDNEARLQAVLATGGAAEEEVGRLLSLTLALASFGRSILLELAAHCLLPDAAALHVRLVPTLDRAIPHHAKRRGLSEEAAREDLEQRGRALAASVRDTFGRDLADPAGYDLVLNSSTLTLFDAVELCVRAFEAKLGPEPGWWCALP